VKTAPYGSWKSPITADLIVQATIGLSQPRRAGSDIYWIEMRPSEGGRQVIVKRSVDGDTVDINPPELNARTRVHEYGGGDYVVNGNDVYFSNFSDQQVYRHRTDWGRRSIERITRECDDDRLRYADMVVDSARDRLIAVREDHRGAQREPENTITAVSLNDGSETVLVSGNDFYSSPRVNHEGSQLAWLTWNHPNMPWDGCELWTADIRADGSLVNHKLIAGGARESIFQPEWSHYGVLHFVSDRSGWWNIYRVVDGSSECLCEMEAEFGVPQWVFGLSTYGFDTPDGIVCAFAEKGLWKLGYIDAENKTFKRIPTPFTEISFVQASFDGVVFRAGSPDEAFAIVEIDLTYDRTEILRRAANVEIDRRHFSAPEPIEFPTENGLTAHGFYYAPKNRNRTAPPNEKPPLLVKSHGGPTSATIAVLMLTIQYWTSRGIAVLDVNYGGSTGYGRAYRERLQGTWGIVDVDDCVNGARFLAERGDVDAARTVIDGGSAGGYTTLCALTFRDYFKAGASHYGVSDLEALEVDTHKFESRYSRSLIGPYPERRDLYYDRSPIHFTDGLSCPVIFFQGLEDKVVPPDQAEMMVDALRQKGLPVAYVAFEGEQHGFRRAENIKRALDGELYFYSQVFGFELADEVEPVEIENLVSEARP
jgi:dipeptidyl aminopeptidase/acylaminoacyl peptidase